MEYFKISKTVNQYWFEPDYVNFEKTNCAGLTIDSTRLDEFQKKLFKNFKYDLVVYIDRADETRFGLAALGSIDKTFVEYPLIKELEKDRIDSFAIRSFRPTRFGGRIEVMARYKDGQERELFQPMIRNIRYDIWDWCVKKYVIDPMNDISELTGIGIGELIQEYEP
ncbi:hypothetical protein WBG78_16265 [Chryseolinea sp. T2]|uniref:hypothetical protein n=1 Tax=Chryseolinea sp. T2 TaxID=3129255 RepID=UPI00307718A0